MKGNSTNNCDFFKTIFVSGRDGNSSPRAPLPSQKNPNCVMTQIHGGVFCTSKAPIRNEIQSDDQLCKDGTRTQSFGDFIVFHRHVFILQSTIGVKMQRAALSFIVCTHDDEGRRREGVSETCLPKPFPT